jgi:hypothetical protein
MTLLGTAQVHAHGNLAEVTIYDRTEGRWLPVYRHEGRAYVAGGPGHEYQIRVRSRHPDELLAVMSVDGVNIITGQTAHPSQSGYVVSPHAPFETQGWRRSLSQTAAFYFTALPDSYAARTGRPDDVGVIGVALFRKKPAPQPPAPIAQAESKASRGAAAERADERLGTGPWPLRDLACEACDLRARDTRAGRGHQHLLRQPRQPGGARRDPRPRARRAHASAVPGIRPGSPGLN